MPLSNEEILNRWGLHAGTEITIPQHENVRYAFIAFVKTLNEIVPDGDAKDFAFTKLQEASMWANFAIAEHAPVKQPDIPR
jgi:hypothetical protein